MLLLTAVGCQATRAVDEGPPLDSGSTEPTDGAPDGGCCNGVTSFAFPPSTQFVDVNESGTVLLRGSIANANRGVILRQCGGREEIVGSSWPWSDVISINNHDDVLVRGPITQTTFMILRADGGTSPLAADADPLVTLMADHLADDGTVVGSRVWLADGGVRTFHFGNGARMTSSDGRHVVLRAAIDGGAQTPYIWDLVTGGVVEMKRGNYVGGDVIVESMDSDRIRGGLFLGDSAVAAQWKLDGTVEWLELPGVVLAHVGGRQLIAQAQVLNGVVHRRAFLRPTDGGAETELTYQGQPIHALRARPNGVFAGPCLDGGSVCCGNLADF